LVPPLFIVSLLPFLLFSRPHLCPYSGVFRGDIQPPLPPAFFRSTFPHRPASSFCFNSSRFDLWPVRAELLSFTSPGVVTPVFSPHPSQLFFPPNLGLAFPGTKASFPDSEHGAPSFFGAECFQTSFLPLEQQSFFLFVVVSGCAGPLRRLLLLKRKLVL